MKIHAQWDFKLFSSRISAIHSILLIIKLCIGFSNFYLPDYSK